MQLLTRGRGGTYWGSAEMGPRVQNALVKPGQKAKNPAHLQAKVTKLTQQGQSCGLTLPAPTLADPSQAACPAAAAMCFPASSPCLAQCSMSRCRSHPVGLLPSFTLLLYLFPTRKSVRPFVRYFPATEQAGSEMLGIFFLFSAA